MSDDPKLNANTTWFRVFQDMVLQGKMAQMGPYGFTVYCVIKAHAELNTGESFPGVEKIAKEAGMSTAQVKRELPSLVDLGYLTRVKVGRHNEYRLRERIDIKDDAGNLQAVASWDFVPMGVEAAVADLRNVIMKGDLAGAKIINIEHMVVNIQTGPGNQVNFNDKVGDIPEGPLGDSVRQLLSSRRPS